MGKALRVGLGVLVAASLTFGASGCASSTKPPQPANKGDATACSTFNLAYQSALNPPGPDENEGEEDFTLTLFRQAASQATSPELAADITAFTESYAALSSGNGIGDVWDEELEQTVDDVVSSFLRVGEFCEQEGVALEGLEELREEVAQSR